MARSLALQVADGLEFELKSDIEDDEDIDEDMAFTEEDKRHFAGMFGDDSGASDGGEGGSDGGDLLLESDASDDGGFDPEVGFSAGCACKEGVMCCPATALSCIWTMHAWVCRQPSVQTCS